MPAAETAPRSEVATRTHIYKDAVQVTAANGERNPVSAVGCSKF